MSKKLTKKLLLMGALAGAGYLSYRKYQSLKSLYDNLIIGRAEEFYYDHSFESDSYAFIGSDVVIDLCDSDFEDDLAYLDLFGFASKITIYIPDDCQVVVDEVDSIFSKVNIEELEEFNFEDIEVGGQDYINEKFDEDTDKKLYIDYDLKLSSLLIIKEADSYKETACSSCC